MTINHPIAFKTIPTLSLLKAGYPGIKALFFDMDGTLFNTEPHHEEAFLQIGSTYQIRPPYSKEVIHELLVGKADHLVFDLVKTWEGFPPHWTADDFVAEKNKNLLKILETSDPTTFFPKAMLELLDAARAEKLFLALVTSSERVITDRFIEITGLIKHFNLVITRDDCPSHKPDPWPYNEAKRISGLAPHEIIIFEDSHVGLTSAGGSDCHVIKVEWH